MWDYTNKVKDHFRNPRNVGFIKDADGTGMVGSMACGDALKLMFKLDEDGKISEAKFQTFGCASAIASSSALTEMIVGKTPEEALQVTNQQIADYLGGLPDQKMHCSVLGKEALEAAVANWRGDEVKPHEEEHTVCVCFGVMDKDIERAIRENNLTSVEDVTNYTKAGGGCGGCHEEIELLIKKVTGNDAVPAEPKPEAPKKKLTNIQKMKLVQETIDREIRPALQADGGDLELVDFENDTVYVSLRGACAQCRVSTVTLRDVVEKKLREFVSDDLRVVEGER